MAIDNAAASPSRTRMWGILLWEQWRLSRAALLIAIPIMLGYVAQVVWLGDPVNRYLFFGQDDAFGTPCFLWAPAIMALLFLHVHPGLRDIRLDFPRRYFVLPIATRQVMLVQLGYRLAVALVLAAPVAYMSWRQPDIYLADFGPASPFIAFLALVLGGQVLAVLVTAYGILGGVVAGAATVAFLLSEALLLVLVADPKGPSTHPLYLLCGAYILLCTTIPWVVLGRIRHGETVALPDAGLSTQQTSPVQAIPVQPFASKLTAQIWFEWKQSMRYFAWVGVAIGALVLLLLGAGEGFFLLAGFYLTLGLALTSGYLLVRTPSSYLAFAAVKPLNNAQLGLAKLASAFLGFNVVLILLVVASFGTAASAANSSHMLHRMGQTHPMETVALAGLWMAVLWLTLVAGRLCLGLLAAWGIVMTPLALLAEATVSRPAINAMVYAFIIVLVASMLACLAAWALRGRIPWRRALVAALATLPILCVCMYRDGYLLPDVASIAEQWPFLRIHFHALPFLLVAAGLLAVTAIVVEHVTWRRALVGVAIAYIVALGHGLPRPVLNELLDVEAFVLCPLAVLAFLGYIACKRNLVPQSWALFTILPCAVAMLTLYVFMQLDRRCSFEPLILLIPVCAGSLLWPPLAVRLQRHR